MGPTDPMTHCCQMGKDEHHHYDFLYDFQMTSIGFGLWRAKLQDKWYGHDLSIGSNRQILHFFRWFYFLMWYGLMSNCDKGSLEAFDNCIAV